MKNIGLCLCINKKCIFMKCSIRAIQILNHSKSKQTRGLRSRACFEQDETRLELTSRIGGTGMRLMFSGLVTRENSGKIREINGTRRDYSIPFGKFPNSTEFLDFSRKTSINSTSQDFSCLVPLILYFSVPIQYRYQYPSFGE